MSEKQIKRLRKISKEMGIPYKVLKKAYRANAVIGKKK